MRTLVISASPREDGNSHLLAQAAIEGAVAAGHDVEHVFLADYVERMLDNCRACRRHTDRLCALDDRYSELLLDKMLPADGIIYAMPLYFYGMPARLKTVFDRLFCYTSNSAPQQDHVINGIMGKKVAVLISCEESYQGATSGVVAQFQELTRYLNQDLVDVAVGRANSRGEITRDPSSPLAEAKRIGNQLYDIRVTDYRLDTERSSRVWEHLQSVKTESSREIDGTTGNG
ncbi:flavodoxin family protein [Mycolicibacterium sp. CBMA 226]|uniref:flavodoxin family protein n=1 Tax=Mycolicibacterium sp. CBMA 226 TaxID=2606611 RepID=UPI0012DE7A08|nr:flavodoxin family protein [Mycolicibacterium sp. CBMA 226]MUL77106.1 flavodoxin family protein [Mycolicibacterium sp. CBMA 226]